MENLHSELEQLIHRMPHEPAFRERLESLVSVYPFNEYEFIIASLLTAGLMTYDRYMELRDEYIGRNMFLYVFEISAPRGFGEAWAQGHLKGLVPDFEKPTKKQDSGYSGEYDFLLEVNHEKIRVEVKASRAVDFDEEGPLPMRALSSGSPKRFDMNFQQIKPGCCDVFVWVGVWRDQIRYWVLSSHEVKSNPYYSPGQHRGNSGEGQLHLKRENTAEFQEYEIRSDGLRTAVIAAYHRQRIAATGSE